MPRVTWWCQGRRFLGWISETLCMLWVVHTGNEECDIWRIHRMIVPRHHHHGSICIDHRGCTATTTSVPRLRPRGDSNDSTRCGVSPCPVHPLDEPVLVKVGEQEKHRETGMKHFFTSNIQIDFTSFPFLMFWRYGSRTAGRHQSRLPDADVYVMPHPLWAPSQTPMESPILVQSLPRVETWATKATQDQNCKKNELARNLGGMSFLFLHSSSFIIRIQHIFQISIEWLHFVDSHRCQAWERRRPAGWLSQYISQSFLISLRSNNLFLEAWGVICITNVA